MATLKEVRQAIGRTLEDNLGAVLNVYDTMPDVTQLPAAVVIPHQANFAISMQRGTDEWEFRIPVLVPRMDYEVNQDSLDDFLSGSGANSVRRVLYENPTLGLNDGTDAFVSGMLGYGGKFETAQINHIGAILKVTVRTPGV